MSNFDEIKSAIENVTPSVPSKALQGWYTDDDPATDPPRKFLAYVLGKSHVPPPGPPRNSVLGYQYAGRNTSTDDELKWRCFKVDAFSSLTQIDFVPTPSTLTIPDPLTPAQLARQNCVDIPGGRVVRSAPYHA